MILVDQFEPTTILQLIQQCVPTQSANLRDTGWADYLWYDCQGNAHHVERKRVTEVLSSMSKVEKQLQKQLKQEAELYLLIEGFIRRAPVGCYAVEPQEPDLTHPRYRERHFNTPYAAIAAWLWQLDKQGIGIYWTVDQETTASALVAFYQNSQNPEHTTLRRYIRQRPHLWQPDPRVETLMGVSGAGIGEVRARALVGAFGTVWAVLSAEAEELEEVEGIGPKTVERLFKAIGRE